MEQRYDWKTSKALYEIFSALYLSNQEQTITELATNMDKELRIISEQVGYLEREEIVSAIKKGRSKFIKINFNWLSKNYPKLIQLEKQGKLPWYFIFSFNSFKELEIGLSDPNILTKKPEEKEQVRNIYHKIIPVITSKMDEKELEQFLNKLVKPGMKVIVSKEKK